MSTVIAVAERRRTELLNREPPAERRCDSERGHAGWHTRSRAHAPERLRTACSAPDRPSPGGTGVAGGRADEASNRPDTAATESRD